MASFFRSPSLIPLPPETADDLAVPDENLGAGHGRHAASRAPSTRGDLRPHMRGTGGSESLPVQGNRQLGVTLIDQPVAQDPVVHAMDWLARLRDDGRNEPPWDTAHEPPAPPPWEADYEPPAPPPWKADYEPPAPQPWEADYEPPAPPPWKADYEPPAPPPWKADYEPPAPQPPISAAISITPLITRVEITERAVIGDELRLPIAWCEMGPCISHHADPETLGEANARDRAIAAGWRVDALNRLVCPKCQQSSPCFWTSHPVVLWDRRKAVSAATLMAAAVRGGGIPGGVAAAENGTLLAARAAATASPDRGQHRERHGHSGHAH